MAPKNALLEIKNLSFRYAEQTVLESVDFSVFPNDYIALIGPNGSGKSTLLNLILGLLPCQQGSIRLFGKKPHIGRAKVGYLAQRNVFNRNYPITVLEVVLMSRLKKGLFYRYTANDREAALATLKLVEMADFSDRSITALSGGGNNSAFYWLGR